MTYQPYCYLIGWSKQDRWYYGSEYGVKSKTANPSNLWESYFTSSLVVKEMREEFGEPDVIEIRKTFKTAEETVKWEFKVLQRIAVRKNTKWLNINDGKAPISKPLSETQRKNISKRVTGKNNPNFGKKTPECVKAKISKSLKGKLVGEKNPMFGKKHSQKSKEKMSENNRRLSGAENPNFGNRLSTAEKLSRSKAHNPKIFSFHHPIHGDFMGSVYELVLNFQELKRSGVKGLVGGRLKSYKEWKLKPPKSLS